MVNINNIKMPVLLVGILSLTSTGCNIYKSYERPERAVMVADSLYREISVGVPIEDTVLLADFSWKELFTDSLLQKHIETGMSSNTDLNVARYKVEEAKALLTSSKLAYLPSLSFNPEGGISHSESGGTVKTYNIGVAAGWELDFFGKLTNAKREAKAVLEQSVYYKQAVQTQLISTIAGSYYTLLMLDKQCEITKSTIEIWSENVRTLEALKNAGQATELDVAQARATKLSVESSLSSLEQQVEETENTLSALLGVAPGHIERGTFDEQQFPDSIAIGVPLQLLQRRPDVRQKEAELAASFYATNYARAAFYPSITLSGSAGWTNSVGAAIGNPAEWLLSALGSLVQPLFNRGENIANLKVAKAQQEEALLEFRQSLLDAGSDVNNSLAQWQGARKRLELSNNQVEALESAVRNAELLMRYGTQNYLEVLTARQSLLQAELTAVSDRFDEIAGVINLYHALGGGY